ncbi:MAG TPA: class I SAM-dependent methyltransferase family protein [Candidatus Bathyarchaeia archaeon]|nr:class I SAM-dependent methyltransferase family protein [Candidatus Bathyarchaeia archaeon]
MNLKEVLNGVLAENSQTKLIKSYDIIGDTIIIRIPPELYSKREIIAEALHKIYPRVRTIAAVPLYAHTGERYRTRDLEVIWGNESLETTYRESGCIFKVDLKHMFLSPRLAYERMRIAKKVYLGETIINMFSGVGCFSILIAKMQPQTKIYSIDLNPYAYEYMKENVALNKVEGRVIPILGDASEEVGKLEGVADRVLMPLPEQAHAFLPSAVRALRLDKEGAEGGTGAQGVIHYYDVSTGRKDDDLFTIPFERAQNIIASAFGNSLRIELEEKRIVRSVAPRKYHVVLDLCVV